MATIITEVVTAVMDKKVATVLISRYAVEAVSHDDRTRFIEMVETEVMGLHEGNIARYRLRLSQYQLWKRSWH